MTSEPDENEKPRGAHDATESAAEAAYRVELPQFEGPLDLLLHLIQKHELDILDIPIGFVAQKYNEYIRSMEALSIDLASEYLVMAATLVHIKSRMLLPPDPSQVDDDELALEEEDPRAELIRRLLEYQKYKQAAADLGERSVLGRDVFSRGISIESQDGLAPLAPLSLFRLMDAFESVLQRVKQVQHHVVDFERVSISDKISQISDRLRGNRRLRFEDLFSQDESRAEMIVTFLALLEMTKLRLTRLFQEGPLEPIFVELAVSEDELPALAASEALGADVSPRISGAVDDVFAPETPESSVEDLDALGDADEFDEDATDAAAADEDALDSEEASEDVAESAGFALADEDAWEEDDVSAAEEVSDKVEEVLEDAQEVSDEAEEVSDDAEEVSDEAEEVSDEAEEVSDDDDEEVSDDDAQEVLDDVEEVSDDVEEVSDDVAKSEDIASEQDEVAFDVAEPAELALDDADALEDIAESTELALDNADVSENDVESGTGARDLVPSQDGPHEADDTSDAAEANDTSDAAEADDSSDAAEADDSSDAAEADDADEASDADVSDEAPEEAVPDESDLTEPQDDSNEVHDERKNTDELNGEAEEV